MSDNIKLIIEIPKEDYKKLVNPYQHNEIWCERLKRIVINGTPLDSVKGEWKRISPAGIYECSCCGQNIMTSDIECYKFCHGCGARMKGEIDGKET